MLLLLCRSSYKLLSIEPKDGNDRMITLHVPQPQLLLTPFLTPLVFYNMHAGKITLIGKIPGSYNVFDMSDIRLSIHNLACFPLEVPFCISLALGPIGEACLAFNGNITLPDQFPDWICYRY